MQHAAVAGRPQIAEVREPDDPEVRPRREHEGDHAPSPAARSWRTRAGATRGHRTTGGPPSSPGRRSRARRRRDAPSRRSRSSRTSPGRRRRGPTPRARRRTPSDSAKAGTRKTTRSRQPGEVDEPEHEREAERHRHERLAEPRLCHRRQVAVQEPPERQLQCVLGAERERGDPRLEADHAAEPRGDCDLPVELPRHRQPAQADQAEAERTDRQRQPEEPDPTDDRLGRRSGRRRRTPPRWAAP